MYGDGVMYRNCVENRNTTMNWSGVVIGNNVTNRNPAMMGTGVTKGTYHRMKDIGTGKDATTAEASSLFSPEHFKIFARCRSI